MLPLEKINENFFNEIGLELQYVTRSIYYPMEKIAGEGQRNIPEVKLVYGARVGKPVMFDANTGVVIDYTGAPYKERKPAAYTDISGHYAENMINALAEQGITLEGAEFKPDEKILQKEYLKMLSRLADYYSPTPMAETSEEYDRLYAYLMTKGVIKEGEKNPDAFITKEDAVKFIIRAINYDEVADIKGIFISGFSDDSEINPDLIGYVAIAKGLKIVSGYNGNFNPKTELTRAQGAVVVYNYLSR